MHIHYFPPKRENPFVRNTEFHPKDKGLPSEINSGDPLIYLQHHLDGTTESKFNVNLIDILDKVFIYNSMKFLSRKQERYIDKFLSACQSINTNYENNQEDLYVDVDETFKNLDQFLGGYMGVDDGSYTR